MIESKDEPTVGCWKPFLVASLAIPVSLCVGSVFSHSGVLIPQLMAPDSPVPITKEEGTWIASITVAGGFIATLLGGFLSDMYGRIRMVQLSFFFIATGYATIAVASNFLMIIIGRVTLGLASGLLFQGVVYVSETSPPKYRGLFLSISPLFISIGVLFMYIIGGYLPWKIAALIMCMISILSFIPTFFYYDSPQWLIQKGRIAEAEKSLKRTEHPANVAERLKEIQDAKAAGEMQDGKESGCKTLLMAMSTVWRQFLLIATLSILQSGSGYFIMFFYTADFVSKLKTSFDPNLMSVILGVTRVVSSIISSYSFNWVGRRTTIGAVSGFGSAGALFVCYSFLILRPTNPILGKEFSWIPVSSLIIFILTSTIGVYPLPWMMPSEIFPLRIRGAMSGICFACLHLFMFLSIKSYNLIVDNLGFVGAILLFAVSSAVFAIFSLTVLIETHDRTLEEITQEFSGVKKRRKTSES